MFPSSTKAIVSAGAVSASRRTGISMLSRGIQLGGESRAHLSRPIQRSVAAVAAVKGKRPSLSSAASRFLKQTPETPLPSPGKAAPKAKVPAKQVDPAPPASALPVEPLSGSQAGSLSILDEPEPIPPRLSERKEKSATCVFVHSGPNPQPYSVLAALESHGFQSRGLVASVEEKGVFVDLYTTADQKRALDLKEFPFPISIAERNLVYSDSDSSASSASAFEGIFEAAARVKAATALPSFLVVKKETVPSTPSPIIPKKTLPPPPPAPPSSPTPTPSPASSKPKPVPTPAPSSKAAPPPTTATKLPKPNPKQKPTAPSPKPVTVNDATLHFNPPQLLKLLAAAKVNVGKIYTKENIFAGEDGQLFAQIEIPGFPHKVYISTSLAHSPPSK
ncbi:hypothetical protein BDY24DRAFT_373845 [Mrakia frigida]|uniref:uncharacterized protein n=1 Tax=Mrakia frigida TaxID=29902 RepID=UPI003FCC05F5